MVSCAFRKCNNNSQNTNKAEGVTFHSFPQDPRCNEKWIKIIQVDQRDEEWLPTKFSKVCSAHFKENYLYVTPLGLRKLKPNAIPAFRPTTEPSISLPADQSRPSSPLCDINVSDTNSIFDTPRKIHLKKQLSIEKSKREKCRREILKLKKQNKYFKTKNNSLREVVKSLKKKEYFKKEDLNELELNMHRLEKKVVGELLVMYKNLPCLWDVTDHFYSNKVARNRAYDKLVEKYREIDSECDHPMLKKKLDNLRTTYRRERQKVIKSKFHNGERYKPVLWYYPLFSFLEQLENSSDEDSREYESPGSTQAVADEVASTDSILQNKRLPQITSTKVEITNEVEDSADMVKLEDLVPETLRATESILPNYDEDIGIMTVEPDIEIKYRPEKRPKPSAVYITETECDYDDETETPKNRTTKKRKKNKAKRNSTPIEIEDHEEDDLFLHHQVESGNTSGFPENDLFAKTMTAQLSELRPKQRFIAQKLMSEVIFFGRLDKLKTETKLQLDGDSFEH